MPDRHVREQLATFSLEKEALSRYFQQIEIEHFIQPIFAWFEETRFDIVGLDKIADNSACGISRFHSGRMFLLPSLAEGGSLARYFAMAGAAPEREV